MKTPILTLATILCSVLSIAQDAPVVYAPQLHLGVQGAAGISFHHLKASRSDSDPWLEWRREIEEPTSGWSAGASLNVDVAPRWEFFAEPSIQITGFRHKEQVLIFGEPNDPFFGDAISGQSTYYYRYTYRNVILPMGANFYPGKNRGIFISPGIVPAYLLQSDVQLYVDNRFWRANEGGESNAEFNLGVQGRVGYSHSFTDAVRVQLSGFYRQFLFSLVRGGPVSTLPFIAGVQAGVQVAL